MTDTPVESTNTDNSTAAAEATVAENTTVETSTPALKDLLSKDLREIKALQNYESVDSMAKSLLSAQEMVGKRVADLSVDELKAINTKLGAPETVEGYDFEAGDAFKAEALEMGLSHEQARKLSVLNASKQENANKEASNVQADRLEAFTKELETEFGSKLEARMDLARKAALELGGEELEKGVFAEDGPMDLKVIKALSEAGKRLFDHESVGVNQVTKFGLTPSEAINEIALMKNNPEFRAAYTGRDTAARKAATDKLAKLYEVAYPS